MKPKAVCIISGGMDSALTAWKLKDGGCDIIAVHYNYGQRTQAKELGSFQALCEVLGVVATYVIDLDFFAQIGASALTDHSIDVPTGGIKPGIPLTYVPFRNGIFLSIAASIAEKEGAGVIGIGVVEEDSSGYPDCREGYIEVMQRAVNLGTRDETTITIEMPLVHLQKEQIVSEAVAAGVPLELTWSCYRDEATACGVCDSCRLRLKGFAKAGLKDPIAYAATL